MKDYTCGRLALFVALFSLFPSYSPAQENPRPPVEQKSSDPSVISTPAPAKFTDVTTALGINFEYLASHTPKKYLIETMGSGVALFDYDNDGRLDIFVVNGAPLSDPTPKGTVPQKSGPQYWNRLYHQRPDLPVTKIQFHLVQSHARWPVRDHHDSSRSRASCTLEFQWQVYRWDFSDCGTVLPAAAS